MTNWIVTMVNMNSPFDKKKVVVNADSVVEALDEFNHKQDGYTAISAAFHSSFLHDVSINQVFAEC